MPIVRLGPRRNVTVSDMGIGTGGGLLRPNIRRFALMLAPIAGNPQSVGENVNVNGTITNPSATATLPEPLCDAASAAVLNNTGLINGNTGHRWGNKLLWECNGAVGVANASLALARWWYGLSNQAWATLLGVDTPGTSAYSGAAFRFSTSATDGTTWRAVTFDGVSQTITNTGVTVTAGVPYEFSISDDGTATVFAINGVVVATHTTNRPAAATLMRQGIGVQTLEAVAKSAAMSSMYLQYNG